MRLLIDGEAIIYKVGFACEGTRYTCPDGEEFRYKADAKKHCKKNELNIEEMEKSSIPDPIENALHSAKMLMNKILEHADVDREDCVIYLKDESAPGFRSYYDSDYKANRKDSSPPFHAANIREYLEKYYPTEQAPPGLEVDDMLGIYQDTSKDTCIVSHDKDLLMVEGCHIHIEYDSNLTDMWISKEKGMKNFYAQVLTGDRTDNIPGIHGIGKKSADKILRGASSVGEMEKIVKALYQEHGIPEERLEINKKLLWICQDLKDLDQNTGDLFDEEKKD